MEFKITKEQIYELARINAVIKERLNEYFPEAFKKDLELKKWYVDTGFNNGRTLSFFDSLDDESCIKGYGFSISRWYDDREEDTHYGNISHVDDWREATPEEIEAALIAEAKKRGYKKGVTCLFGAVKDKRTISTDEIKWDAGWSGKGGLCMGMNVIFTGGTWNEILPTEKTVISKEKALKILAKKLKVSPENIEIE